MVYPSSLLSRKNAYILTGRSMIMEILKCRKSVFCSLFLLIFLFGTICGVFLFYLGYDDNPDTFVSYGLHLSARNLLFSFLPLLFVLLLGFASWGCRLIPALVTFRGLLMSYRICVLYTSGVNLLNSLTYDVILLPIFFFLCVWGYRTL